MAILLIFLLLEVLNVTTFNRMRAHDQYRSATLTVLKEDPRSNVVNYLIGGMLNQSETTFHAYQNDFEGTVIAVNFKRTGWDPQLMAEVILRDIDWRHSEVRIWAVSVGDQVARWVEKSLTPGAAKTVAINPCTTPQCLQKQYHGYEWLARLIRDGVCEHFLGWASLLPIIPMAGTDTRAPNRHWKYSPMLLADQLVAITNGRQPGAIANGEQPDESFWADFIVLSSRDQFLDSAAVKEVYERVPEERIIVIDADHAGTAVYETQYHEAIREATTCLTTGPDT